MEENEEPKNGRVKENSDPKNGKAAKNRKMENNRKSTKSGKTVKNSAGFWKGLLQAVLVFLISLILLVCLSIHWALKTWKHLSMDELVFHLLAPLDGTNPGMVAEYLLSCALPALLLFVILLVAIKIVKKRNKKIVPWMLGIGTALAVVCLVGFVHRFWTRLDLSSYLADAATESDFIRENYVNPAEVTLTFPEKDRNLLFIFLESMETTYADRANGGAFEENVIPNLTDLAKKGEDFSGSQEMLNGGYVMPGATFTMGAMFAHTSTLPLKINIGLNNMDLQDSFFSDVISLGDVLKKRGYAQTLMIGSSATFGGRKLYFEEHGDFEILDYDYALSNGWIPPGYHVWWGYEDERLFSFAKEKLLSLAEGDAPFHFSLLTVDTHFENGYVCESCREEFGKNQYANVMACSDRKVSEFIEWVQQQEFYKDTTIVIVGDHLTMDSDFCADVKEEYQRKVYTAYINAACEPSDPARARKYTTLDTFPTVLSAMGIKIKGEKLGLGTNLFSETETLIEKLGFDYMVSELNKKSTFMEELGNIDIMDEMLMQREGRMPKVLFKKFDEATGKLSLEISNIKLLEDERAEKIEIEFGGQGSGKKTSILVESENGTYEATLDISPLRDFMGEMVLWIYGESGKKYKAGSWDGYLPLMTKEITNYLSLLKDRKDCTVFIAVKDEGTGALTEEIKAGLKELGLETDWNGKYRDSYIAVIGDGVLAEESGKHPLYKCGTLKNSDCSYEIMSAGFACGNACSIRINGIEHAVNSRGMNIVVWSNKENRVLDSICFDTCLNLTATREPLEPAQYDHRLFAPAGMEEYLSALCEMDKKGKVIFIAAKGNATLSLSEDIADGLRSLGLAADLSAEPGCSYYAAIFSDRIIEQSGCERIAYEGETSDGVPFGLLSAGAGYGSLCSITVDGKECAINANGFNFVVYDQERNNVIASFCFDRSGEAEAVIAEKQRPTAAEEILACDYLETLMPKEGYVYFIAAMDEATNGLTDAVKESMKKIGLQTDLTGQYRSSYYAVIASDGIWEEMGYSQLHKEGRLKDGEIEYEIMSAGFACGNDCSIKINGEEYAVKYRGLNIVVYDEARECVVDSVCLDTFGYLSILR